MSCQLPSTIVLWTPDAAALVVEESGATAAVDVRIVLTSTGYALRSGDSEILRVEPATAEQMDILKNVVVARLFERMRDGSFACVERVAVEGDSHAA